MYLYPPTWVVVSWDKVLLGFYDGTVVGAMFLASQYLPFYGGLYIETCYVASYEADCFCIS